MDKKRIATFVAIGVIGAFLLGLGIWWVVKDGKPPSNEHDILKVGIIPITDCAQLYVAQQEGIFEKHGLDVEFVKLPGGAVILQALSAGEVDVAFTNLGSVVYYEKNVAKLKSLAGGTLMNSEYSEAGLVVRADSGINDLEGLKGKTIAVNTFKNIVDLAVRRALRKQGVPPSEVKLVELRFQHMEAALRSGQIDAATFPEPILTKAMASGGLRNLGDHFALAVGEMYATGYFTTSAKFSDHQDAFQRFNKAMRESTSIANAFGPKALDAISKYTNVKVSDLEKSGRARFIEELPATAIGQMSEWMQEEGFFEE